MRSTFSGLEIAKSGLTISQIGLDLTGHNISNVNTAGYTRQRLLTKSYDPAAVIGKTMLVGQGKVGRGVLVKVLDQVRSSFLDRQFRIENTSCSYWQTRTQSLTYVQSYFEGADGTTTNDRINNFFKAAMTVSTDSVEGAQRVLLQTQGELLADNLNNAYNGLIDIQNSQNSAVKSMVEQINTIAQSIAELNKSIYTYELTGEYANDLRDKRNLLVDELSSIIDIEYDEGGTGSQARYTISIGGKELVNHTTTYSLGYTETANVIPGEADVYTPCWLDATGNPDPATPLDMSKITGGQLKAYIDMRDGNSYDLQGIPYYIEKLNNMARVLVQQINAVHREGYTYPTGSEASKNGVNFFWEPMASAGGGYDITQVTAKNIRLSDEVQASVYNIACSDTQIVLKGDSGELQAGNNNQMTEIYNLFNRKDIELTLTDGTKIAIGGLDGYATGIAVDVANTLHNAESTLENRTTLLLDADNQRLSVSGVSLDEEMTSLIKYQHAYQAASRVISAMDEVIDRLINNTGRVGL